MLSATQHLFYKRMTLPFVSNYVYPLRLWLKLHGFSITINCVKNNIFFSVIFFSLATSFLFYSVERGQRTLTSFSLAHSHNWPLLMSWLSPTSTRQNSMDFRLSTLNSSIPPSLTVNKTGKRGNECESTNYQLPQNSALTFDPFIYTITNVKPKPQLSQRMSFFV